MIAWITIAFIFGFSFGWVVRYRLLIASGRVKVGESTSKDITK